MHETVLGPRESGFSFLTDININSGSARRLAAAADNCWKAVLQKDIDEFGGSFTESFEAQAAMFPHMVDGPLRDVINS